MQADQPRVAFVGAGAVGLTLAQAMDQAGITVTALYSRGREHLAAEASARVPTALVTASAQDAVDRADLVFLSVPDDAVRPVCLALAWRPGQAVVHCSGATELDALASAAATGAAVGAFHPIQMFTPSPATLAALPGSTVTIDAGEPLASTLDGLARRIGCRAVRLEATGRRAAYHASAYYVGPFLIALMREAAAIWQELGATEAEALAALLPLLRGTVAAVEDRGLAGGMGGCIARGDTGTVEGHLAALDAWSPEAGRLYRALALRTIPLALARGSLAPDRAERIRAALTPDA
ncbi:MAG: Rossmann-like and DUF2520 domain-containing protein [Vicinamibacterales bacterium]